MEGARLEGYLRHRRAVKWKRRWVWLQDAQLCHKKRKESTDEPKVIRCATIMEVKPFDLEETLSTEGSRTGKVPKGSPFEIVTADRSYYFMAKENYEMYSPTLSHVF